MTKTNQQTSKKAVQVPTKNAGQRPNPGARNNPNAQRPRKPESAQEPRARGSSDRSKGQPSRSTERPRQGEPAKRRETPVVTSNRKNAVKKVIPAVKRTLVPAHLVSAIILEELSIVANDVCNFTVEVELLRAGRLKEAYRSVVKKSEGMTVVSPYTAWVSAQAKAAVSKLAIDPGEALTAAIEDFRTCEEECAVTNLRVLEWSNSLARGENHVWEKEFTRFRDYIGFIVGTYPDIDGIIGRSKYGPGASVDVRGNATHYFAKLHSWDCVPTSVDLCAEALYRDRAAHELIGFHSQFDPNSASYKEAFIREATQILRKSAVTYDSLMFVHKKATMMRSIGTQPTQSGMIQLGIDSELKRLLLERVGIDLLDQGVNRRLARLGSLFHSSNDAFCTIDLSSASNRVAKQLVRWAFPNEWSTLLFSVRSPDYREPPEMGGEVRPYEMYAGMGNGTTFSVETILFSAACYAVGPWKTPQSSVGQFSVYGDDIIVRKPIAQKVIDFLTHLGLKVNKEKSFISGPFKESCGADYYAGTDIRPTYVNGETALNELQLVGVHNTLMDSKFIALTGAAQKLRSLWKKHFPSPLPSDPSGGLGFRTAGTPCWQMVLGKDGKPSISPAWHRPRGYVLHVDSKRDQLEGLSSAFQLTLALGHGNQSDSGEDFSLDLRNSVIIKVIPEIDLRREDLVQMVKNQLQRLAQFKTMPWWGNSRGK